ncbi:cation:proton antiporter [Aestuariivirga sp.]|uniref:cation:proton antiporter domain-containing protein n=1 Tax=Aestuariivirga sp. TaxID=2650926 RepID=UPI0039E23BA2
MVAESVSHFKDALIVLGTAGVAIPLLKRIGINNILGFMLVGVILGPNILGGLALYWPPLSSLALTDEASVAALGELGVVFLLFLIGLELSPERLLTMKRLVFGLGVTQVVISMVAIMLAAKALGLDQRSAIVVGMALSLSSTAIVVQMFTSERRLGTQAGRTSFAVLLLQDLAIIPMLILVDIMGDPVGSDMMTSIGLAALKTAGAIAVIVAVGRFGLRPLLKLVSASNSPEIFMSAVLFIAIGTGALATSAGLSMSLGAFVAGLMLAETEYRRAIEAIIEPFKGLLLGLFFLLVGLGLDIHGILAEPIVILGVALGLIALKAAITYALARYFRVARHAALESAFLLGPCGEFAFVIIGAAAASNVVKPEDTNIALLVVTLTMFALPVIGKATRPVVDTLRKGAAVTALPQPSLSPGGEPQVIIAGYGRVGSLIASMLEEHNLTYLAIDTDVQVVSQHYGQGHKVFFGDAVDPVFLSKCGLATAKAIAVTMDNPVKAEEIVRIARQENPGIKIIARARDERHAMKLYLAGVTEAVPETIESSLQLGEALLVETGVPMGLAIASVHERRDGFRKLLGRPNRREAVSAARRKLRNRMPAKERNE